MHTRALLNATTTASVSAAGDPADTLTSCVVRARGFLWISSALLLLAGASAALYYAWLKKKKTSGRGHGPGQPTHARLHCALLWPGGVLVGGWGVMGVVLSTSSRYCDPEETKSALVTLSTAVASACLLVSIGLLTNAVFASIRAMVPGQEVRFPLCGCGSSVSFTTCADLFDLFGRHLLQSCACAARAARECSSVCWCSLQHCSSQL